MKTAILIGAATALLFSIFISYGRHCRAEGIHQGVNLTLCAFSVGMGNVPLSAACKELSANQLQQAIEIGEAAKKRPRS